MNTLEILSNAQNLIRDPRNWAKHTYSKDMLGMSVEPTSPDACRWCSIGAVLKVLDLPSDTSRHPTFDLLEKANGNWAVPDFNDTSTHEEVMEMFDKAKELARAAA